MIYFDATFLLRLYYDDPGCEIVRELAVQQEYVASSIMGKLEATAGLHRKLREGTLRHSDFIMLNNQLLKNTSEGVLIWIEFSPDVIQRVQEAYLNLPSDVFLRTGDAIHLATAAEAGFKEIYSNDRHLLAAAPLFKLKGINPLVR